MSSLSFPISSSPFISFVIVFVTPYSLLPCFHCLPFNFLSFLLSLFLKTSFSSISFFLSFSSLIPRILYCFHFCLSSFSSPIFLSFVISFFNLFLYKFLHIPYFLSSIVFPLSVFCLSFFNFFSPWKLIVFLCFPYCTFLSLIPSFMLSFFTSFIHLFPFFFFPLSWIIPPKRQTNTNTGEECSKECSPCKVLNIIHK